MDRCLSKVHPPLVPVKDASAECGFAWTHRKGTYLSMPALLINIVTVPKLSTAVLMTEAPSATEDEFATAFPPAKYVDESR